jgi:hypothetical protein
MVNVVVWAGTVAADPVMRGWLVEYLCDPARRLS